MEEKLIGRITHYFNNIGVGVIEVTEGTLKDSDTIHIKGATSDFEQKVSSMQIEHQSVKVAKAGQSVGLKTEQPVRENDQVYLVTE